MRCRNRYAQKRRIRAFMVFIGLALVSIMVLYLYIYVAPSDAQPQQGGNLTYGELKSSESTIEPITYSNALSHRLCELMFDGLLSFDEANKPIWKLASGEPTIKNQVEYSFDLRTGIKWSSGQPITPHDVRFTYYAMKNNPERYQDVEFISDVRVNEQNSSVTFILRKPVINTLGKLSFKIVPYHPFLNRPADINEHSSRVTKGKDFVFRPIGSGPYIFDRKEGQSIKMKANEHYFPHRPYVDTLTMRPYSLDINLANALIVGAVDLVIELNPFYIDKVRDESRKENRIIWHHPYRSLSYYFFALNQNHPFLGGDANKKVRQAINYATNRAKWLNDIENGSGELISGPFPHDSELANTNIKPYPYDSQKAKNLLEEAGFKDTDNDGILEKGGRKFTLRLKELGGSGSDEKLAKISKAFIDNMKEVGIKVESEVIIDQNRWGQEVYYDHNFDVVLDGWMFSSAADVYPLFHSSRSVPGGYNYISYNNPVLDDWLEKARDELDPTRLRSICHELHEMLHDECPYVYLWTPIRLAAGDNKIRNHTLINPYGFFTYIYEWYIEE